MKNKLSDTILTLIEDYSDGVLKKRMHEIYEAFQCNHEIFDIVLNTNCDDFLIFINEICNPESSLAKGLVWLNSIFNSENLEDLKTSFLYQDVLGGKIFIKPTDDKDGLNTVNEMRQILTQYYETIVEELKNSSELKIVGCTTENI